MWPVVDEVLFRLWNDALSASLDRHHERAQGHRHTQTGRDQMRLQPGEQGWASLVVQGVRREAWWLYLGALLKVVELNLLAPLLVWLLHGQPVRQQSRERDLLAICSRQQHLRHSLLYER